MKTFSCIALVLPLAVLPSAVLSSARSAKRGLCFAPNPNHASDNNIWVRPGSDLRWYYNYQSLPSPAFASVSREQLEFVPMMWGVGANPNDTSFLRSVRGLLEGGTKIRHVLGLNEPDGTPAVGGSNVLPADAALAWAANFEPLGELGLKLGLPACTGGRGGLPWLKQFLANCSALVSTPDKVKNCTWDFLPVHWYDNFAGLASHIGERRATWPDAEIWVTEYAYAHQDLQATQAFYNQTVDYLDRLDYIGRYSYFGAFRSTNSNVGANAAFLNKDGKLTDIGSWYSGFGATGVIPESSGVEGLLSSSSPGVGAVVAGMIACVLVGLP